MSLCVCYMLRSCLLSPCLFKAGVPTSLPPGAYLCLSPLFLAPSAHTKDFVHVFCKYPCAWGVFVLALHRA